MSLKAAEFLEQAMEGAPPEAQPETQEVDQAEAESGDTPEVDVAEDADGKGEDDGTNSKENGYRRKSRQLKEARAEATELKSVNAKAIDHAQWFARENERLYEAHQASDAKLERARQLLIEAGYSPDEHLTEDPDKVRLRELEGRESSRKAREEVELQRQRDGQLRQMASEIKGLGTTYGVDPREILETLRKTGGRFTPAEVAASLAQVKGGSKIRTTQANRTKSPRTAVNEGGRSGGPPLDFSKTPEGREAFLTDRMKG